ncbi:hypothetical protein G6F56_014254 [Rhizopus delemar]|nr:hypothetical protein G6F56_014254 [Rhizopus delemar]
MAVAPQRRATRHSGGDRGGPQAGAAAADPGNAFRRHDRVARGPGQRRVAAAIQCTAGQPQPRRQARLLAGHAAAAGRVVAAGGGGVARLAAAGDPGPGRTAASGHARRHAAHHRRTLRPRATHV